MNILIWIVFGGLVGWIASLLMSTNEQQGVIKNIIIGMGGAVLGGFLARILGVGDVDGFDAVSLLIAIVGAMIIIAIMKTIQGRSNQV